MKAYLWKTGQVLSPFEDPVGDLLVLNRPLRDHQASILRRHGLEVEETEDPCTIRDQAFLLIREDLFFSDAALGRFLTRARQAPTSVACSLQEGPFTDFTGFAQPLREAVLPDSDTPVKVYGLYYCRDPLPAKEALDALEPLAIDARQMAFPIQPGQMLPSTVDITFTPAYTDAAMIHVCHWAHLWLANLLALGGALFQAFTRSKLKLLLRALSALSLNKHKIASRFVLKGKGCDIHPSAVVQGCILGRDVTIGAHCLVQGCMLGDGVKVNEHSILLGSVFGEGSSTSPRGWTKFCVVYPKSSTTGHALHASVVGRNVFMASPAYLYDLKIKGTIKVLHNGERVDTGLNFLGSCVGHEAIIGPDIWLASGMEIPNRAVVVKNPEEIITSIPGDLPEGEYLTVRHGRLVPVRVPAALPEKP